MCCYMTLTFVSSANLINTAAFSVTNSAVTERYAYHVTHQSVQYDCDHLVRYPVLGVLKRIINPNELLLRELQHLTG